MLRLPVDYQKVTKYINNILKKSILENSRGILFIANTIIKITIITNITIYYSKLVKSLFQSYSSENIFNCSYLHIYTQKSGNLGNCGNFVIGCLRRRGNFSVTDYQKRLKYG